MPVFAFRVFSAQNLLSDPNPPGGTQPFNAGSTNPPNTGSNSFTTGNDTGFILRVDDTGTGSGNSGSQTDFDDGTQADQVLAEDATFTYTNYSGNVVTTTFAAGSQIQAELQQTFSNGSTIVALRIENPNSGTPGEQPLITVGYTFIGPAPPPNTPLGTVTSGTGAGTTPYTNLLCFTAGMGIPTPGGPRPVETLKVGDLILTHDNGPQPIAWTGKTALSELELARHRNLRPVMMPRGRMGAQRDLVFSPQHRVLVSGPELELTTGHHEALAAIGHLAPISMAAPVDGPLIYYHIACADHQIIAVEGLLVETLLAIPEGADAVTAEGVDVEDRIVARPILKRWEAALLATDLMAPKTDVA